MSLNTILDEIEASGEAELAQLRRETNSRIQVILTDAERNAVARREEAQQKALRPLASECSRRLHQARLEALQIVATARDQVVAKALAQTQQRMTELRNEPSYPRILLRLFMEAIRALGDEELHPEESANDQRPRLQVDLRDEVQVSQMLHDLGFDLTVEPSCKCWGGVILHSGDGRIVVTNTLESRLKRAMSYLRRELATFFEESGHSEKAGA